MPVEPETEQNRLTVAGWRRSPSLRSRLALAVALSVSLVIGAAVLVGIQLGERLLTGDLKDTATLTAVAVADDTELRLPDTDPDTIVPVLHDFIAAAPSLRTISVFVVGPSGPTLLASTSSDPTLSTALIDAAIRSGDPAWDDSDPAVARVAVPITRGDRTAGAVVVAVAMTPVLALRRGGQMIAIGAAATAVVGVTLLILLLADRLIHAPIGDITRAMARAQAGRLDARAPVRRHDELGMLASRLNEMLAELEDLHASLTTRVDLATRALRERNDQLVRSHESVLHLRREVGRAEQLAAVGQTLANVAHQIGTPLNLVSGHVQLLLQSVADPDLQRRLHIIDEQVERVASSVRGLLDRSRPVPLAEPVDIGSLLRRLLDAVAPQLAAAGVTLHASIPPGGALVLADETALELALLNLVTNALDAMPRGGSLTIDVTTAARAVQVIVRDTGGGIPDDLLPRVFEPWVSSKGDAGNGLGLSIARDVLERIGGTIGVASQPGHGSTFTVTMPTTESAPTHV